MFLSIIIPYYNLPRELLERCLKSIIAQNIPDNEYEVIVVDDGSETKPTWATTLSTNIKLTTSEHRGPGGARNKGIELASGKYVMFVDADDYLLDNGEIHNCIDKLKKEHPQILRYGYVVKRDNSLPKKTKGKRVKFSNTISGAVFMEKNNLSGSSWTFFLQRELVIKKGVKFPENTFHEDEEFNTIIHYHAQSLIESNATLYSYCIRSGSTTANDSNEFENRRISNFINIIERINSFAQEHDSDSNSIQKRAIAHKLDMLTVDAILNMMFVGMSAIEIKERCENRLGEIGLYPLRKASYSLKYKIFRLLANSKNGMRLLRIVIPSKKPAKK